jgi:hypothetical protein
MGPDPDPGGPKTCGSGGSGSGSATLSKSGYFVRTLLFGFYFRLVNINENSNLPASDHLPKVEHALTVCFLLFASESTSTILCSPACIRTPWSACPPAWVGYAIFYMFIRIRSLRSLRRSCPSGIINVNYFLLAEFSTVTAVFECISL